MNGRYWVRVSNGGISRKVIFVLRSLFTGHLERCRLSHSLLTDPSGKRTASSYYFPVNRPHCRKRTIRTYIITNSNTDRPTRGTQGVCDAAQYHIEDKAAREVLTEIWANWGTVMGIFLLPLRVCVGTPNRITTGSGRQKTLRGRW